MADGTVLTACDRCRLDYEGKETPCDTCRVDLLPENEDAATVYMITRRQYITAENGRVVDISIPAVKTVMDLYGVREQRRCMSKVLMLFHRFRGQADESQ